MATKKISEFTTLGSLSDNDILPVVSGGANKKITASVLKTYAQTGIDTGNITFSGDQISSTGEGVDVTSTGYAQLSSNNAYVWAENNNVKIEVNGFTWTFDNNANLTLPDLGAEVPSILYADGTSVFANVGFSGNYSDLTGAPSIPTSLSDLGITAGSNGQVLTLNSSLTPVWATPSSGGNPFDQSLNTTDSVTFTGLTLDGNITSLNGSEFITQNGSGGSIDIYTDWTGNGVEVWLQHGDKVAIKTENGTYAWDFDNAGKLILPEIGQGLGWINTDSPPTPDTGFLYSSTISFDKNQGILLTNNVAGTDISWVIGKDGKLKLPAGGDIVDSNGNSVLGGNANTGDITFDGVKVIGAETNRGGGSIELVPNDAYYADGQYLNIYPTNAQDAPHIHLAAGTSGDLILGDDNSHVDVNHNGYVRIRSYDSGTSNSYQWRFHYDGNLQLPGAGAIEHNGSYTRTSTSWFQNTDASGVVWTGTRDLVSSVKLTIQTQSPEVGDSSGSHFQTCEAIIASRGVATSGYGVGEPVMTVYGVTHTSTAPLATFSVQRNATTKLIEIVATRTAATDSGIDFRIHSVEMIAID